jgi:hypothetical protein
MNVVMHPSALGPTPSMDAPQRDVQRDDGALNPQVLIHESVVDGVCLCQEQCLNLQGRRGGCGWLPKLPCFVRSCSMWSAAQRNLPFWRSGLRQTRVAQRVPWMGLDAVRREMGARPGNRFVRAADERLALLLYYFVRNFDWDCVIDVRICYGTASHGARQTRLRDPSSSCSIIRAREKARHGRAETGHMAGGGRQLKSKVVLRQDTVSTGFTVDAFHPNRHPFQSAAESEGNKQRPPPPMAAVAQHRHWGHGCVFLEGRQKAFFPSSGGATGTGRTGGWGTQSSKPQQHQQQRGQCVCVCLCLSDGDRQASPAAAGDAGARGRGGRRAWGHASWGQIAGAVFSSSSRLDQGYDEEVCKGEQGARLPYSN